MRELGDTWQLAVTGKVPPQVGDTIGNALRGYLRGLLLDPPADDQRLARLIGQEQRAAQADLVEDGASDVLRSESGDGVCHPPHSPGAVRTE